MDGRKLYTWLAATAALAATVIAGTGGPASADEATVMDASVQAELVMLRPAPAGGYTGTMDLLVGYTGPDGAELDLKVVSPEGLYLNLPSDGPFLGCTLDAPDTHNCLVTDLLTSGETRHLRLDFTSLAAPTADSRRTLAGSVTATTMLWSQDGVPEATPEDNSAQFVGLLVGTGDGYQPAPYQPATTYDLTATVAEGTVTFAPDSDSPDRYVGTTTMTIRAGTDAYHQGLYVTLPVGQVEGASLSVVEPAAACVGGGNDGWTCALDGPLAQGASRTITLKIDLPAAPAAGTAFTLRADTNVGGTAAEDANPVDNTVTVVA